MATKPPQQFKFDLSPIQTAYANSSSMVNIIYSSRGEGKCLTQDTDIIMFSGKIKKAGDIIVGDLLMGDDSTPRKVLSTCTGEDDMYEVIPVKGESFKCNKEHILVLDGTKKAPYHKEIHVAVKDYIGKNAEYFKSGHNPLIRKGIDFPTQPVEIDPYMIGCWLADGGNHSIAITTADKEIVTYLEEFADRWDTKITVAYEPSKANTYHLTNGNVGHNHKIPPPETRLFLAFKKLNLFHNKHIPDIYKFNSREVRLQLLAGLVDGDGYMNHEGFDYLTKYKQLADDIVYLCRSLDLAAYVKKCTKGIKSTGFVGEYYRIHISGDCSIIPVILERRKCKPRKQVKRVTVTGIKEIKSLGRGKYCGFTLDGNHKFLLGSFIVSHNTFAVHAQRNKKAIRCAIVRDTHENIKISVVRAIQEIFPRSLYDFKNDFKQLVIKSEPHVFCDLFGIDDLAALQKLQGPEYSLVWLEEPAPMSDKANAGLSEDVYNAALIVCARQKDTIARLQVSMNPADQDHWTYRRFLEEPDIDPLNPLITKAVFAVPYGDNAFLSDQARQAVKVAYKNDPASYARYVENKFVSITKGKKVTPDYGTGRYTSDHPLEPAPGLEGFRAYDGWHSPACILGQITHTGRLIFIDTIRGDNIDIRTLIKQKVQPVLNSPRWKGKCKSWRDIGDISMKIPDQSNINESAARVIEKAFGTHFEGGPARWTHMKRGIDNIFTMNITGKPAFIVNKANRALDKALAGGWSYKVDNAGNVMGDKPLKNDSSHVADAWANAVNVLLPSRSKSMNRALMDQIKQKGKNRAASYSV
jgi:intein/homing endonuclease